MDESKKLLKIIIENSQKDKQFSYDILIKTNDLENHVYETTISDVNILIYFIKIPADFLIPNSEYELGILVGTDKINNLVIMKSTDQSLVMVNYNSIIKLFEQKKYVELMNYFDKK